MVLAWVHFLLFLFSVCLSVHSSVLIPPLPATAHTVRLDQILPDGGDAARKAWSAPGLRPRPQPGPAPATSCLPARSPEAAARVWGKLCWSSGSAGVRPVLCGRSSQPWGRPWAPCAGPGPVLSPPCPLPQQPHPHFCSLLSTLFVGAVRLDELCETGAARLHPVAHLATHPCLPSLRARALCCLHVFIPSPATEEGGSRFRNGRRQWQRGESREKELPPSSGLRLSFPEAGGKRNSIAQRKGAPQGPLFCEPGL